MICVIDLIDLGFIIVMLFPFWQQDSPLVGPHTSKSSSSLCCSFGNKILYPWGHTSEKAPDWRDLKATYHCHHQNRRFCLFHNHQNHRHCYHHHHHHQFHCFGILSSILAAGNPRFAAVDVARHWKSFHNNLIKK